MKKQKPRRELKTILHEFIPERLVQFLCNRIYPSETSEKVSFYVIPLPPQGQALRSLPSRSRGAGIQKLRKRLDPRIREDDRQVVFQRFPSVPIQRISDKDIKNIDFAIHNFKIVPRSTAGYDKADVTLGGVETREISSQTMESKKCPGLYFIGEVLDVAGDLGGYNLHWAWASGYAAGDAI
ncbi:NAD(P)/FAD-dependent oxidoreductase [bacterium]|nr:NAD(P)/FAD-dependent oxidoreductase [bacterium]